MRIVRCLILAFVVTHAGCVAEDDSRGRSTAAASAQIAAAPERSAARFEIGFMTDMIDHHMMAIEMATICLDEAVHDELRQLCEEIIATQSSEIEMMQSWLSAWYGIEYEPSMSPGMQSRLERLAAMSGAEFEITFMEDMIRHHEGAIREGDRCLERAFHAELIELCESIIVAQSEEIELMESWLCDWYGDC